MVKDDSFAIGIDIGGTKIAAALVTEGGSVIESDQVMTQPDQGPQAVVKRIVSQINHLVEQAPGPVRGVGIGSPGHINAVEGIVQSAINLGWSQVYLVDGIRSQLVTDLPIWIEKDANASAMGEYYFGAAQECSDFIYISIGTGLGGGIFTNNRLVSGAHGKAANLGHLALDPNGLPCSCGSRGCLETILSGTGMIVLTQNYLSQELYSTQLTISNDLTSTDILAAARHGDDLALAVLSKVARTLGMVMAVYVATLNPKKIIIGGGLGMAAFDFFVPDATIELKKRVFLSGIDDLQILPSRVKSPAVGAASLVWYNLNPI